MKKTGIIMLLTVAVCSAVILTGCGEKEDTVSGNGAVSGDQTEADTRLLEDENALDYVELGEYKGLECTMSSSAVTDEEVEDQIETDLAGQATTEEITGRAVEEGDIVNIDFCGKKDGVAFEGGTSSEGGYDLTIGSNSFIDGFEDGLIGAQIGETRDLNLTFPENYGSQELAGQDVVFTVSVNSIKVKHTPELTDELAVSLNSSCSTAQEYRDYVRQTMEEYNEENAKQAAYEELITKAQENATIKETPQWLIDQLQEYMSQNIERYAQAYGMTLEDYVSAMGETMDQFQQESLEYSETEAQRLLVVYAIAQTEGLEITDEEKEEGFAEYLSSLGVETTEEAIKTVDGKGILEFMQLEKVEKFLFENAEIIEESPVEEAEEVSGNEVSLSEDEVSEDSVSEDSVSEN